MALKDCLFVVPSHSSAELHLIAMKLKMKNSSHGQHNNSGSLNCGGTLFDSLLLLGIGNKNTLVKVREIGFVYMDPNLPYLTCAVTKNVDNLCPCTQSLLIKFHCLMNCCDTVLDIKII